MPSIFYSTTCSIRRKLYRFRICIDEKKDDSEVNIFDSALSTTSSLKMTSTTIPINCIQAALIRLDFQLLDEKKSTNHIPKTINLNHLLNVEQTTSLPSTNLNHNSQRSSLEVFDRTTKSQAISTSEQQSLGTGHTTLPFQETWNRRQGSFPTFFSSLLNSDSKSNLLVKTSIKIKYVDVSNLMQWKIKSLELVMDSEDIANELHVRLDLCLSTLKQRPHRLLVFVNPLSGKGMNKLKHISKFFGFFICSLFGQKIFHKQKSKQNYFLFCCT